MPVRGAGVWIRSLPASRASAAGAVRALAHSVARVTSAPSASMTTPFMRSAASCRASFRSSVRRNSPSGPYVVVAPGGGDAECWLFGASWSLSRTENGALGAFFDTSAPLRSTEDPPRPLPAREWTRQVFCCRPASAFSSRTPVATFASSPWSLPGREETRPQPAILHATATSVTSNHALVTSSSNSVQEGGGVSAFDDTDSWNTPASLVALVRGVTGGTAQAIVQATTSQSSR